MHSQLAVDFGTPAAWMALPYPLRNFESTIDDFTPPHILCIHLLTTHVLTTHVLAILTSPLSDIPTRTGPETLQLANRSEDVCWGLVCANVSEELVTSGLIHWQAKSQSVLALSALEAECITCSHATRESLRLRRMMKEAADGMAVKTSDGPVPIGCDNQGAIKLIAWGVVRQKAKHIDVEYHHVHDGQKKGSVKFQYVTSESNPADLLIEPLAAPRHEQLFRLTGLTRFSLGHGKHDQGVWSDKGVWF